MDYTSIISQLFIVIGVLVAIVNIATEIAKATFSKITGSKTINIFVLILSEILTVATFLAYWQIRGMAITWYLILAFLVIGVMVAYAAMFGFDKLLKYFESWTVPTLTVEDDDEETADQSKEG